MRRTESGVAIRAMSDWAVASVVRDAEQPAVIDHRRQAHRDQLAQQGVAIGGVEQHGAIEEATLQVVGRADHRDAPVVDDADALGVLGLIEVVGREEDRGAVGVAGGPQVVPEAAPADRVEAGGRLVEEQHAGAVHEAADDLELALHAARERAQRLADVVGEADHRRQLLDALAVLGRHRAVERPVPVEAVDGDVEADVLLAREMLVDARVLEDDPDVATDAFRIRIEVVTGDRDRAARLGERRGQDRDRGGLARAVRPEEGEQLAGCDIEADVVDGRGGGLLVLLRQVSDGDHGFHACDAHR